MNVFLVMAAMSTAALATTKSLMASESSATVPGITLSSRVPVVGKEIEFRLDAGDIAGHDAEFTITGGGANLLNVKVSACDGKFTAGWIPAETGFYTASFASANLGKVSLEFPVVWRDMYFIAWPPLHRDDVSKYRYLSQYIILHGRPGSGYGEEDMAAWKSAGSKVLSYVYLPRGKVDMSRSEDEVVDELVAKWSAPLKKGFDGIFIDEFGMYPKAESLAVFDRAGKALVKLRQENPDMFIFPANAGALLPEQAMVYNESGSVALLETYPTCYTKSFASHSIKAYIDRNVEVSRNTDLVYYDTRPQHSALILLGFNGLTSFLEESAAPELEELVRYIKKTGPEMPGIGFYNSGSVKQYIVDSRQMETADRLCHDYYIKPVVDLRDILFSGYTPVAGKPVDVLLEVHNLGGMDAKRVRVRLYAKKVGADDKVRIGETVIEKIGCGHKDLQKLDKNKDYEYQTINGNVYAVYDKINRVFLARTTVKFTWAPKEKGYYSIIAEVEPSTQYTVLDGVLEKHIGVR